MKRLLILLCLFSVCGLLMGAKADKAKKTDEPADLLLFCGGRPWAAGQTRNELAASGIKVKLVDSAKLAGFGGASIKKFATDKEPVAKDGITPEFARLDQYKAVMFTAIPPELLSKMLTPERIEALEKYVQNGGGLLLDNKAPEQLAKLLPVKFTGSAARPKGIVAERPALGGGDCLPARWDKLTDYRPAEAKPEAQVHSMLKDASDKDVAVGVVSMPFGKGKVVFYNGSYSYNAQALVHFCHWAYSRAFMGVLLGQFPGMNPNPERSLQRPPARPAMTSLGSLDYAFLEENTSYKSGGKIEIERNIAHLPYNVDLRVGNNGDVRILFPNASRPVSMNLPVLKVTGKVRDFAAGEHEAIEQASSAKPLKIAWTLRDKQVKEDRLELTLDGKTQDSQDVTIRWQFIPFQVVIDGRRYVGVGDRVILDKLSVPLAEVEFTSKVPYGKVRRLTCYTNPRGYLETMLSKGEGNVSDTHAWQFYNSGQPFTYVAGTQGGIFVDFPDEAMPSYGRFTARKDGNDALNRTLRWSIGRRNAPVELPIFWHIYSPGKENGNNDYIAVYQFVRRYLRTKYGIKSFPQITLCSCYLNGRKPEDIEKSMQTAAELNFKGIWLTYCPLPMEQIGGDKLGNTMKLAIKHGLQPHPWTAGGYGHGDAQKVFVEHPDWFVKNQNGTFKKYFKQHSVGDFNNPAFRQWYLEQVDAGRANGMARIYMDMGGAISGNVNYATAEADPNLIGFVELIKEYSKRNLPVTVEGMNPLVRDQALMRPDKSYPMVGKEFAYIDSTPLASVDHGKYSGLYFDYFRLGMFHAAINIDVDGYRLKFERVPGEIERVREIGEWNKIFNEANEFVPIPFIRETPFGSAWIGTDTGALFFERPVEKLNLKLPQGWKVKGNASLTNIPAHSVIYIQKK